MGRTQRELILRYVAAFGSITNQEGYKLGINCPWKRISELRQSGLYEITTIRESGVDKNSENKYWVRYYIKKLEGAEDG